MTIYSISMQIYYDLLWLHGKLIFPSYGKLIVVGNKDVKVSQRISPVGSPVVSGILLIFAKDNQKSCI